MLGTMIITSVVAFFAGAIVMARYKDSNLGSPVIEKIPTRETFYANQVINTAAKIYCNYNESKIIRIGEQIKSEEDRYYQALQESLKLVGSAYRYFDMMDSDESENISNEKTELMN